MTAKRRSRGTTSLKSWSRFPAISVCWIERPVALPPGRARLATRPLPRGSFPNTNTMGIVDVACFTVGAELEFVTIISALSRANSAANSAGRSGRPFVQRYSIATVRPSIQPSSRSRAAKAAVHGPQDVGSAPISLPACCPRAASGHAAAAPPSSDMNARRLMLHTGLSLPPAIPDPSVGSTSKRRPVRSVYLGASLPWNARQVLGTDLDRSVSEAAAPHPSDDDISPCADDYGLDLCLLGCGHSELVESLLEIVEKGLPFGSCDPEMLVRVLHRTTRVLLWSTSSPADHFRDEVLEAWR